MARLRNPESSERTGLWAAGDDAGIPGALFDQLSESVAVYAPDGRCLYLNETTARLFGKPRHELVGRVLREVFHDAVGNAFERVARTGNTETFEHYYPPWKKWLDTRIYRADGMVWVFAREITESKTQKERYRELVESMDDGFSRMQLLFDDQDKPLDYRILETNAAFEGHTGLRQAVGKTARELVPDLDSSWFELYGRVALTGQTARIENHIPALGRWYDVFASRVGSPELRQVGVVFKDITTRKKAEEERQAALEQERIARAETINERRKLHELFMQTPVAICILEGPQHVFTFANPAYRELAGGRGLVGKPLLEALPDLSGQGFDKLLDGVMTTGQAFHGKEVPVTIERNDAAETLIMNFVYTPKRNIAGEVDGVLVSGTDVTEQVRARQKVEALAQKLSESEDRLSRVAEASGTGTWQFDHATQVMVADSRFRQLLGLPEDLPLTLDLCLAAIHPDELPKATALFQNFPAGKTQGYHSDEYKLASFPAEDPRWIEVRAQLSSGQLYGTVVDVTARKNVEAERSRRLHDAQRAIRAREDLLSIVSHDLRNPLSTVVLSASMIRRMALMHDGNAMLEKQADAILRSAGQMERLVADLLDLTRIETGRPLGIEKAERSGVDLARQAVELLTPLAAARRITLEIRSGQEPCRLCCDGDRVQQVLSNLVGNAIKYTNEGGRIVVSVERRGQEIVFSVADDGVGIGPESLPHIFDAYWQLNITRRGVGLGLSVAKAIVEAHDGRVWVQSAPGKGSTFSFALPAST